jgi:hypothetical protein
MANDMEGTTQMHIQDNIEVLLGHILKRLCADNSGVVDKYVEATIMSNRCIDDCPTAVRCPDGVDGRKRIAARCPNFLYYCFGGAGVTAVSSHGHAGVVDNYLRAACSKE